jgi:CubicO group peptidase (beta-lactamase class C family)
VIPLSSEKGDVALISLGESDGVFAERLNEYVSFDAYSGSTITTIKSALMKSGKKYSSVILNVHSSSILPRNNFSYPMGWESLIDFCANYGKVIVTLFGNPYVVNNKETFANASAAIFAFEQSKQGEDRAAQLIAGGFKGVSRLPITLCEGLEEGVGVETPDASRLKFTFPEELGISREKLKEIDVIAQHGIDVQAYPGCQIVAAKDGKVFYRKSFGKLTYEGIDSVDNHTVYDIASITKIASSTVALMKLQDEGKFSLDHQLKDYLPTLTGATPFGKLILRDILSHQAGLTPWIPFYTKTLTNGRPNSQLYTSTFSDAFSLKVANDLFLKTSYEEEMYKQILGTPIKPGNRYKYSDVGYYFTKKIIEQETGKSLDAFVENSFYIPMGLRTMRYNPLKHYSVHSIAPTEQDTYFRHELVRGYVHDMGAAMTNGVGGHAGVFSRATDLTALMQMLLNDGVYGGKRYLSKAVIKEYTSCQFCPRNRRGAGFDKPVTTLDGGPTCDLVSLKSFGHSGFTGTLTWADPEYGINYTFLSNRVYPSAENWKIVRMGIRTDIQKIIYEAVLESNQENQ